MRKFVVGKRKQDQDTPRFWTVLESLMSVKSIPLEEHADIYALSQAEPGTPACWADVGATGSPALPTHQCQSGCPSPACWSDTWATPPFQSSLVCLGGCNTAVCHLEEERKKCMFDVSKSVHLMSRGGGVGGGVCCFLVLMSWSQSYSLHSANGFCVGHIKHNGYWVNYKHKTYTMGSDFSIFCLFVVKHPTLLQTETGGSRYWWLKKTLYQLLVTQLLVQSSVKSFVRLFLCKSYVDNTITASVMHVCNSLDAWQWEYIWILCEV